jgi:NACHT domain
MDASCRSECLQGTRLDALSSITDWIRLSTEQRVLWLHGLAGSGKSTLSTTIANIFREQGCLGASVFFNRDLEESSQPRSIIKTIAYQLGSFDNQIGAAIATNINTMPSILQSPLHIQFRKLLVEPLSTLPTSASPIVLILDALDECGGAQDRRLLLSILSAESIRLPPFVRVLITSRAEFDIRAAFLGRSHISVQELDITSDQNMRDISSFLRHRIMEIRCANPLPPDWPGDRSLDALAEHAAGLFEWASTACRFIEGYDPQRRLDVLLRGTVHSNAETALNTLYRTALKSVGGWGDEEFCADFRIIMGVILVAKNPLSDSAIDKLLSLKRPSRHLISRLGCVLSWSDTAPIRILHPSFADFLSDRLRCGSPIWYIHIPSYNRRFSVQCLNYMNTALTRNICKLTLSLSPVNEVLPEATSYACRSWIDHIVDVIEEEESTANVLEHFLFHHLLHWIESMSILKESRATIISVRCLHDWLRVCDYPFQHRSE